MNQHQVIVDKWIKQIASGDEASFRKLFDLYYPRLYRLAISAGSSGNQAEELALGAFQQLWLNRQSLSSMSNLESRLLSFTMSKLKDYLILEES